MKLLKEPLLHFAILGAVIFAVNGWREEQRPAQPGAAKIEITAGTIAWLGEGFAKQWHREPDAAELRGLVNDHLREEVLYREALALGLDGNDTIVRRRMAQKMEFLGQDIAGAVKPDEAALRKFFELNPARYAKPARVDFQHVYFSKEKRAARLETDAREAMAVLAKGAEEETLGDGFLGGHEFSAMEESDIAAMLGSEFASRVVALPTDQWQGPFTSTYGLHLVRVTAHSELQPVKFETVAEAVARDFSEERRLAANSDFIQRLKERYVINVDEAALEQAASPTNKTATR